MQMTVLDFAPAIMCVCTRHRATVMLRSRVRTHHHASSRHGPSPLSGALLALKPGHVPGTHDLCSGDVC